MGYKEIYRIFWFHGGEYKHGRLLGCCTLQSRRSTDVSEVVAATIVVGFTSLLGARTQKTEITEH
jgi:hypothetical protein